MARRTPPTSGAELRATRQQLGVSQAQLARDWGISPRMVRKLEASDQLPAGYRNAADKLAGGRVVAPERRVTREGAPVRVRAAGGRTAPAQAPRPGSDRGITYARGTGRGAPVVRRVEQWVPYEQTPRPGVSRAAAHAAVDAAVHDAFSRGQRAVVTAAPDGTGGGYVVTVTGLPEGASAPHGAGVLVLDEWDEWDDATWDELADDAGLGYGDAT